MKLLTFAVRNYRNHRHCRVEFAPDRTVIAGPNESGKSTLAEAIHRALFVPATVTGQLRDSMLSQLPGATQQPEVELEFVHAGQRLRLFKRFAGQRGVHELTVDGKTYRDEAANEQLASLLQTQTEGRLTVGKAAAQWAHLFTWQDDSASDPFAKAGADEQARLLGALRRRAGAEVLVSSRDAWALTWLQQQLALTQTPNGSVRAGSPLALAISAAKSAAQASGAAQAVVDSVLDYARRMQQCKDELASCELLLRQNAEEIRVATERHRELQQLQRQQELCQQQRDAIAEQSSRLQAVEDGFAQLAAREQERAGQIAAQQLLLSQAEAAHQQLLQRRQHLLAQRQELVAAGEQARSVRDQLAGSLARQRELHAEQTSLRQQLAALQSAEARLVALAAEDADRQHKQQTLQRQLAEGRAAIQQQEAAVAQAQQQRQQCTEALRQARLQLDAWQALGERQAARAALAAAERGVARLQALRQELQRLEREHAELLAPDAATLAELEQVEQRLLQTRARCEAMATRIQLQASPEPIRLGDVELPVGGETTLLEPTILQIGQAVLRLVPGGGDGVVEQKQQLAALTAEWQQLLRNTGVATLAEARQRHAQRAGLAKDLARQRQALANEQPAAVEQALLDATERLQRSTARLLALQARLGDAAALAPFLQADDVPADALQQGSAAAQQLGDAAERAATASASSETELQTKLQLARRAAELLDAELRQLQQAADLGLGEQHALERMHGDAAQRLAKQQHWQNELAAKDSAVAALLAAADCQDANALQARVEAADAACNALAGRAQQHQADEQAAEADLGKASAECEQLARVLQTLAQAAAQDRGELEVLQRSHGDHAARDQQRRELALKDAELAAQAAAITRACGGESCAAFAELIERCQRDQEANRSRMTRLQNEFVSNQGALTNAAGTVDPFARLAACKVAEELAVQHRDELQAELDALLDLIARLSSQTRRIVQHYAASFDAVVQKYLVAVFGPAARVEFALADQGNRIEPLAEMAVSRPEFTPVKFEALSRGAREQLAMAMRLAAAEVLAKEGDGNLPVVLDDAFVHSDQQRMRGLLAMIDQATAAGLQIIIFTCDERAYGRVDVSLQRQPVVAGMVPSAPSTAAVASPERGEEVHHGASNDADPALLLSQLQALGGSAGNQALRQALGWDEARFDLAREALLAAGRVQKGRGRGGSLCLPLAGEHNSG